MNILDPLNTPGFRNAASTFGAYPAGIGPCNRTMPVGISVDALGLATSTRGASIARGVPRLQGVGDVVNACNPPAFIPQELKDVYCAARDIAVPAIGNLVQQGIVKAKLKMGYTKADPYTVNIAGDTYVILVEPVTQSLRKIGPDGSDTAYTPSDQSGARVLSPAGTWQSAALPIALVAGAAALFLLLRRR